MKQSIIAMIITGVVTICGGSLGMNTPSNNTTNITTQNGTTICTDSNIESSSSMQEITEETLESLTKDATNCEQVTTIVIQKPQQSTNCQVTTKPQETQESQVTTKPQETQVTTKPQETQTSQVTTKPQETQTTQSPQQTTEAENGQNTSFARQVVELVNIERSKAGLNSLSIDTKIETAAMIRSQEIEKSFSHTRPNGSSFSTVLSENGVSFRGSGENIAWGQRSPEEVMNGWMNSSGHRANILNPNYQKIGVGYYVGANGRAYWTQLFTY